MTDNAILSALIGHDGAKAVIRSALRTGEVDILLEGPPASGKSVVLLAIEEKIPGSKYRDAAGFTEVQLRETIAHDYFILCLDEIDAMRRKAYEALSTPMEHGRVTKDTANEQWDVEVNTQFFAACNDVDDLPAHTASRFRTLTFQEYTRAEFIDVCEELLVDAIQWITRPTDARHVGEEVYSVIGSKDPRDARDAAKLAGQLDRVGDMAKAIDDPSADIDSVPVTPQEVQQRRNGADIAENRGIPTGPTGDDLSQQEWAANACEHLTADPDEHMCRELGRYLCPDCADEYGVSTTTPLSAIDSADR